MDVVLIILGILGFGAILISTYVFTVAARSYVSDDLRSNQGNPSGSREQGMVARNPVDRRSRGPVTFPLNVNGILIANDRRGPSDRRMAN